MSTAIAAASAFGVPPRVESFQSSCFPAADSGCAAGMSTASDYQQALNIFGDVVGRAKQGAKFGHEDMLRFREGMREAMARPDLPPGVRDALSNIEVAFQDSYRPDASDRFGSSNWADFLGRVGDLLSAAPGGAQIGQAFKDFSDKFRRADRGSDVFDRDDMARLEGRSSSRQHDKAERGDRERSTGRGGDKRADHPARSSEDLVARASDTFEGKVFGAEDFSRFFKDLNFDSHGTTAPQPSFPSLSGPVAGGLPVWPDSPGPVGGAVAVGSGVAAGNGVYGSGNVAIGRDVTIIAGVINVAFNVPPELPADLVLSEASRLG